MRGYPACVLLLATELLLIALYVDFASSELGAVDIINGPADDELQDAVRARAAA